MIQVFPQYYADPKWQPIQFGSSLVAWYRPRPDELWSHTDGTLAVPGGAVRMWRDASGNGNHLDQPSGVSQPNLTTEGERINGYSGIKTDGVDDFFEKLFTLVQPCTIAAVVRPLTVSTTKQMWVAGADVNVAVLYTEEGTLNRRMYAGNAFIGSTLTTDPVVQIMSLNGASSRAYQDSVWTNANLGVLNPGGVAIGSNYFQLSDANGICTELLAINRKLTTSEETLLSNYLTNKYAIS